MRKGNGSLDVQTALKRRNEAVYARSFVNSKVGKVIIDGVAEEVTRLSNKLIGQRLEREEYIETRAKIEVLRSTLQGWANDAENVERYQELYERAVESHAQRIELENVAR